MNGLMKKLTGFVVTTVVTLSALPFVATPVFAFSAYCEIKLNSDGTAYTECNADGATTEEELHNAAQQAVTDYETSTGDYVDYTFDYVVHSVSKDEPTVEPTIEPTPAQVHTCQDDGYSADYYWSEAAQACITDYVTPTPEPTPVPTPVATPEPTLEPVPDPVGGEYYTYTETRYTTSGKAYYCTISGRSTQTVYERIPWNNEKGYVILGHFEHYPEITSCSTAGFSQPVDISLRKPSATSTPKPTSTPTPTSTPKPTPKPTSTPKPTQKPTVKPTSTPTATPTPTPVASAGTWDYAVVGDKVLALINEQRVASGLKPLTVLAQANTDATQRANESMEFAKSITAYGTATDAHLGYDTEWGSNEALGFISRLSENATEGEIADEVYKNLTTGVTKQDSILSDSYNEVALGFADAHFTRRSGSDLGHNVYFSILLGK